MRSFREAPVRGKSNRRTGGGTETGEAEALGRNLVELEMEELGAVEHM